MSKKDYSYDADPVFPQAMHDFRKYNGATDHVFNTVGPSLTRQEFKEECDINTLMSKYDAHVIGGPGNMPRAEPFYADFTQVPGNLLDYMEFMNMAQAQFMALPAAVRREFDNSPHMFVEFASDPENIDQLRTWGLAPPKPPEKPQERPAAAPASQSPPPADRVEPAPSPK